MNPPPPSIPRRLLDYFRGLFRRLLELRDTPHAIAGGVAIGMFWGFTPLFGLKTALCLVTAWAARCSKLAAVISVCLHDIITPFWPVLLTLEYEIGRWILSRSNRLPEPPELHHIKLADVMKWTTFFDLGLPLLVGSMIFAIPAAAIAYTITYAISRRRAHGQLPPAA